MSATAQPLKKGIDLRELQAKFIQNRVALTEKNIAELCRVLTGYTLNCARLRDSSDQVSQILTSFSDGESVCKSLAHGLRQFSVVMSELGDIRDTEVNVLEERVLSQLAQYEDKCKYAKSEVSTISGVFSKEAARRKDCEKLRQRNQRTSQTNTRAESDYAKAQSEVTRTLKIVEEKMQVFEEQKIRDLKSSLLNLVMSQIRSHAKALEVLTHGYKCIEDIDEQEDLQSFLDVLSEPENIQRLETVKKTTAASNTSLNTIAGLFSNTRPSATDQHVSNITPEHKVQYNSNENEEEDDEDKTISSKSHPTSLVQKIKSLKT